MLGAVAECRALESIVLRSGIEVYGRGRGSVTRPDEDVALDPTCEWGRMLAGIEQHRRDDRRTGRRQRRRAAPGADPRARTSRARSGASCACRRSRSVRSPIRRSRSCTSTTPPTPSSPPSGTGSPSRSTSSPPGAVTALQAIRRGRRLPVPLFGPDWAVARGLAYVSGAPLPDHVLEMLHRGRLADNSRARDVLRFEPSATTREVIDQLYRWPSIVHTPARRQVA